MATNNEEELTVFEVINRIDREQLDPILDSSFEGWYQKHAKRTLRDIETVLAATIGKVSVGLAMLKKLDRDKGYVYYIAVLPQYRGRKVGSKLLDSSLGFFAQRDATIVFASLMQEHEEANFLFGSRGFVRTSYGEMANRYGKLHAINLYRKMLVVSGEVVVYKELRSKLDSA